MCISPVIQNRFNMVAEQNSLEMCSQLEAPPCLNKSVLYSDWVKRIRIWQKHTGLNKSMQGAAIYLALEPETRSVLNQLNISTICNESGVENLISQLKKIYIKNEIEATINTYKDFETFERPKHMPIAIYINHFEDLLNKVKKCVPSMHTSMLAHRLFISANLSET